MALIIVQFQKLVSNMASGSRGHHSSDREVVDLDDSGGEEIAGFSLLPSDAVNVGDTTGSGRNLPEAAGEETEINWFSSTFYLGNFFTKQPDNVSAKCNSCPISSKPIKTKSGNTTGLDSHLSRKHRKVYEKFLEKKAEVEGKRKAIKEGSKRKMIGQDLIRSKQSKLSTTGGVLNMKPPPPDPRIQKELIDATINLAVESGISFNALSGPAFRSVVDVLNRQSRQKVKVLSGHALATHVTTSAEELLQEVTAIIRNCRAEMEGVSFTTDIWTSATMESFISLTVHWIDKEWTLHRWTPFIRHFPDRHTGQLIKIKLDDMITSLGLDSPEIIKYVVNDNAVCAIKLSPDLIQILCAIHTLQLSVGDTFKDASVGPTKMKNVLTKGKALAKLVNKSGPLMQELKAACAEVKISYTSLKNPNETRWHSEVTNLSSIIKLEKALMRLVNTDTTGQWSSIVFSPGEWRLAKAAVKVLQIPLRVTKMWEGEKYPTMNLVVSELYGMKSRLQDLSSSSCSFSSQFALVLMNKVEKRFPNCAASDDIPAIANYIDPAFKGVHIEALGTVQLIKAKILERWKYLEDGGEMNDEVEVAESAAEVESTNDPTAKLIRARQKSGDQHGAERKTQLEKEMDFYEANVGMEDIRPDGDRLGWWKMHEKLFPLLAKVAKHVLGIPCSSAKSERVFSTGGMMVSKKRHRLGPGRVENLLVLKENRKIAEEFRQNSGRDVDPSDDAFKVVVLEVDTSLVNPPPISAVFDSGEAGEGISEDEMSSDEESSDDEFEIVFNDV